MKPVTIDFFELVFLAEVCIPPVPIARASFWQRLIDEIYYQLTPNERNRLFRFITDTNITSFDINNKDCKLFYDRYNPENQYSVIAKYNKKEERIIAFLYKGKYHTTSTKFIAPEYIIKIEKIEL